MKHDFEFLVACDVLRMDGSPARLTLAVPCELEEVGPLPLAGEFILWDRRRVRYFGHDGGVFVDIEPAADEIGSVHSRLYESLREAKVTPVPLAVDGLLHRVTRRPVTDRMLDGYVSATDPVGRAPYVDDGAIDATVSDMHAVVARNAVVSRGRVMARTPPPAWKVDPGHPGIFLWMRKFLRSQVNGMDEFAASRIDAARAYCSAMGGKMEQDVIELGAIEYLDPAFICSDDLVALASRAGPFVASRMIGDLQVMPPEFVARWHNAVQASSLQPGDTWRAGEVLRNVADLIRYGENPGNDCGLRGDIARYDGRRRWDALLKRIFEVEGIEPSPFVAGHPQGPTSA